VLVTSDFAEAFADEWIAAWNSRDLNRILSHYSDDFTMSSPRIAALTHEASGVLHGKIAVADYWRLALSKSPELHFTLLGVFVGADSVALHYRGTRGPAVEVFFFDEQGLVCRACANYLP
jgi:ketosteroid isomerase-like protein